MGWLDRRREKATFKTETQSIMGALLPGLTRTPPERGIYGMLNAYGNSPWVAAVASKIATSFGSQKWHLYATREHGTKYGWRRLKRLQKAGVTHQQYRRKLVELPEGVELVEVYDHPLLDLLEAGSPMFPGNVGRMLTQLYIELTGEAFWWLDVENIGDGQVVPTTFYPIPPTWVKNTPASGKPYFEIQAENARTAVNVPMEVVIWFVNPNPANPYIPAPLSDR